MAEKVREAGKDNVFIFKQQANDDIDIKIFAYRSKVIYQTMTHEGEVLSDMHSCRPYSIDKKNDGTTRNCLHALFQNYLQSKGADSGEILKTFSPEDHKFHISSAIVGRREGVVYPNKWGYTELQTLKSSLKEVGLDRMAKLIQ